MSVRLFPALLCLASGATQAAAEPSEQHVVQSANYSALAVSHGSAAVASAASTVVAVPIVAFGSVLTISGGALQTTGAGALAVGAELSRAGAAPLALEPVARPNGPPKLD